MKKLLLLLILVLFCSPVMAKKSNDTNFYNKIMQLEANETWQKVGEHLYFDTKSVKNDGYGYVQGTFKQYNIKNTKKGLEYEKFKNRKFAYSIISVTAFYNVDSNNENGKMDYPKYKYYNIKGKLLGDDDIHKFWKKKFPDGNVGITYAEDVKNGYAYYNTLHKYYSPEK